MTSTKMTSTRMLQNQLLETSKAFYDGKISHTNYIEWLQWGRDALRHMYITEEDLQTKQEAKEVYTDTMAALRKVTGRKRK